MVGARCGEITRLLQPREGGFVDGGAFAGFGTLLEGAQTGGRVGRLLLLAGRGDGSVLELHAQLLYAPAEVVGDRLPLLLDTRQLCLARVQHARERLGRLLDLEARGWEGGAAGSAGMSRLDLVLPVEAVDEGEGIGLNLASHARTDGGTEGRGHAGMRAGGRAGMASQGAGCRVQGGRAGMAGCRVQGAGYRVGVLAS